MRQNIVIALVASSLVALHLFLYHTVVTKLRSDLKDAIEDSKRAPEQVKCPQCSTCPVDEEGEKWRSLVSMNKNHPDISSLWFTVSQKEAARLEKMEHDDPALLDYIRQNRLIAPPPTNQLTKLPSKDYSQYGETSVLLEVLGNKTNGFFVECGAFDGLTYSNTFVMERKLNWTGVMIEAEPTNFKSALEKHRNVTLVPACLSLTTKPALLNFSLGPGVYGKINHLSKSKQVFKVQCLPLYSILLALNRTTVDLFSLDIEGNELDVLKTIPFDKVDIKVLIVEWNNDKERGQPLNDFMIEKGYILLPHFPREAKIHSGWAFIDKIFIKKGSGYRETRVAVA